MNLASEFLIALAVVLVAVWLHQHSKRGGDF